MDMESRVPRGRAAHAASEQPADTGFPVTESVREKLSSLLVGKQRKEHGSCVHGSFSRKSRRAGGWLCPTHLPPFFTKKNQTLL